MEQHNHNNNNNNNNNNKIVKQSNLEGRIVESLDVEGFGDCFQPTQSKGFTRIAFQNSGPQPQFRTSKKSTDGALAMSAGKSDAFLLVRNCGCGPNF